jgi:hypothetical protein
MAVTQISKIQIRRGLQENLPQLSSAEMGWSIDEQRLFIGNGTLAEGAPMTGVTEILTSQSMYSELVLIESLEGNVANMTANITSIQSNVANIQSDLAMSTLTLTNNTTNGNIGIVETSTFLEYSITRASATRFGWLKGAYLNGVPLLDDEYTESAEVGVTFGFTGNMFQYTTTNTGSDATFKFYVKEFL